MRQEFGEVKHWYLAGHSLGGAMAGSYAAKHESEIAGLIFLAAYPTRELQTLPVLSLYGSEDGVLNMEKYQEAIGLAADCRRVCLRKAATMPGSAITDHRRETARTGLRTGDSGRKRSITSWT